ncbi:hypothetical protein HUJ05_006514 [Dendroctonus ponderosae]|nr:hypothetical protein HUJ05_006514 [Dendroctonus ponderosae]
MKWRLQLHAFDIPTMCSAVDPPKPVFCNLYNLEVDGIKMTTPTAPVQIPKKGIVKQVLSGDAVVIRSLNGAPPPEKQLAFSGITAPKLARRPGAPGEGS